MKKAGALYREGDIVEECWCGSGRPYGECHKPLDDKINYFKEKGCLVPGRELIKTPAQIEGIRKACVINTALLDLVGEKIRVGMTTEEIDKIVYDFTMSKGAVPAPLGFYGYPKSCCTSINDQVCHGIPSSRDILRSGDIVNVDVSTIYEGYYADASRMFILGKVDRRERDFVAITKECLNLGIKAAKGWGFLGDIGAAIAPFARKHGYSVVEEFGGHGVGNDFHEEPFVCHVGRKDTGMLLVPGMVLTIEPMINEGKKDIFIDEGNGWTVYTCDGGLSAQWEHTILITEDGAESLTY